MIIGNKSDSDQRVLPTQHGEDLAKHHNIPFFETSAKDGVHVNEAFVEMVKMGIKRESENKIVMPDSIGGSGGGGIKL